MDPAPAPIHGLRLSARTAGGIAIARLSGELAIASSPVLRDELLGLLRRGSTRLILDLSGVTSCDASGLAVLVGTSHRARLLGGSLGLAALSAAVDDRLHATGLRQHFDVFATVEAAAATVTGQRVLAATRRPAVA
jgi:anti-sigma B factor antagonist